MYYMIDEITEQIKTLDKYVTAIGSLDGAYDSGEHFKS